MSINVSKYMNTCRYFMLFVLNCEGNYLIAKTKQKPKIKRTIREPWWRETFI